MSSRKKMPRGRPSKFPPEFRKDAVAMVLDESRSIAEVARATSPTPSPWGCRPLPAWVPLLAVVGTIIIAYAATAWPTIQARRARPAGLLRTE